MLNLPAVFVLQGGSWENVPREVLEGPILAVSRQTKSVANIPGAPKRYSFAKISEPIAVPGLLDLQLESFAWLIGTPEWRERQQEERGEAHVSSGLEDILAELSPIQDYSGNMSLS